jgi:hypothetical protein
MRVRGNSARSPKRPQRYVEATAVAATTTVFRSMMRERLRTARTTVGRNRLVGSSS